MPQRLPTMDWLRVAVPAFAVATLTVSSHAQAEEDAAANAVAEVDAVVEAQAPADPYAAGADAEGFGSFEQRVSYAIGASMGGQMAAEFAQLDFNVDASQFGQGFGDAADADSAPKLTEAQMQETLMQFQMEMQQRQMAKMQESLNADAEFLKTNAEAEGVVTTESGTQYKITEAGDGPLAQPTDTVMVHYEGKLLDGTVFDSSIQRGQPVPFPLDGVIPGFQDGLTQMPIGSKGTLYIPGEQAYGPRPPQGSPIGPNQMLIFDVELIEIVETPLGSIEMVPEAADAHADGHDGHDHDDHAEGHDHEHDHGDHDHEHGDHDHDHE